MASMNAAQVLSLLEQTKIAPVFFHPDIEYSQKIVKACYEGGMRVFEFTNRGVEAPAVFSALRTFINEFCPEMALGIGTIFNAAEALDYINMGTDFIVQPITSLEVGEVCKKHHIPWLPAAATLNEIWHAKEAGATVVKLFPGNVLGPGFVKAIKGPLPNIKVMVTGGVEPTQESIQSWLKSGANYLGMGSQLFAGALKTEEDFAQLSAKVKQVLSY